MVKPKLVVPPSAILAPPNALMITGGATTVIAALEVLPVPPLVELTCTLLFFTPDVVPVMFTEMVQEEPGAREAPVKLTLEDPSAAVAVPLQVLLRSPGVATTKPLGRLSVKAVPFRVKLALVLLRVNVRLVVPFNGIVAAPKTFATVGGLMTVRFAEEVLPLPASVESIVTLLLYKPSGLALTSTLIVQAPTGRAALLKLMVPVPAVAVTVPPQAFTTLGVAATTMPAGSVSVKLESIVTTFGLFSEKVMVLGAFTATVVGLKLLVMEGGCSTIMLAVTVAWSTTASALPPPATPPALNVAVAWAFASRASGWA